MSFFKISVFFFKHFVSFTRFEPETADLNAESMISFIESVKSGKLVGEPVKSHEDDEAMHDEL